MKTSKNTAPLNSRLPFFNQTGNFDHKFSFKEESREWRASFEIQFIEERRHIAIDTLLAKIAAGKKDCEEAGSTLPQPAILQCSIQFPGYMFYYKVEIDNKEVLKKENPFEKLTRIVETEKDSEAQYEPPTTVTPK